MARDDGILAFFSQFSPTELNSGEDRLTAQMFASLNEARSLDELHSPPLTYRFGYERHHIVEQNPANLTKECDDVGVDLAKFGRDKIDEDSNIVWVPRFKHELITNEYNSLDEDDFEHRLRRKVVGEMGFANQREAGLAALRKYGVLK